MSSAIRNQTGFCRFCGLPVAVRQAKAEGSGANSIYCCFGCRLAESIVQDRDSDSGLGGMRARIGFAVFFTMNVVALSMVLWTQDFERLSTDDGTAATICGLLRYLCLFLSLPVLWILGQPLAESAFDQIRAGVMGMDALLLGGVIAATVYSIHAVFVDRGHVYFEVACVVLVVTALGKWIEANGKLKATESLSELERLIPAKVRIVQSSTEQFVDADMVKSGTVVRVLPGECVPCDGALAIEVAELDQHLVTGESQLALKCRGDRVFAGSFAVECPVSIVAEGPVGAGTLARMVEFVRSAAARKGRFENLTDRVSAWFAPAIVGLAIVAAIGHGLASGVEAGLKSGLAVALIACPCALGLATPMAFWAARNRAARNGVILHGEAIEKLAKVGILFFDKTGTLTEGTPKLSKTWIRPETPVAVQDWAAALASTSNHPLARVVAKISDDRSIELQNTKQSPGRGLQGELLDGKQLLLGSQRFLTERGTTANAHCSNDTPASVLSDQSTGVGFAVDGRLMAWFEFSESLRPECKHAIANLKSIGLGVQMLTGDRTGPANRLAAELQIPFRAELLPEDKVRIIEEARNSDGCRRVTAFVGDGVNDAPALAAADVGIAMGCGADLSRATADVCLLGNNLDELPRLFELSRQTMTVARQNLFWAFGYNIVGVGLAVAGWLHPIFAGFAMAASSLFVVGNSLRLNTRSDHSRKSVKDANVGFSPRASEVDVAAVSVNHSPGKDIRTQGVKPCLSG